MTRLATLRDSLEKPGAMRQLTEAAGAAVDPKRLVAVALTAATRNPMLAECSAASIYSALLQAAACGIEPDGRNGHLVPYRNRQRNTVDCQFIADYKGLIRLALANPKVLSISSECVYSGDDFDVSFGSNAHLIHKPRYAERGDFVAVWALAKLADGAESFEVLSAAEVAKHRSQAQTDTVWSKWFDSMARKTAVKALAKFLPLGAAFDRAAAGDEQPPIEAQQAGPVVQRPLNRLAANGPPLQLPELPAAEAEPPKPDTQPEEVERPPAMKGTQKDAIERLKTELSMHGKTLNALVRRLSDGRAQRYEELSFGDADIVIADLREMANKPTEEPAAEQPTETVPDGISEQYAERPEVGTSGDMITDGQRAEIVRLLGELSDSAQWLDRIQRDCKVENVGDLTQLQATWVIDRVLEPAVKAAK